VGLPNKTLWDFLSICPGVLTLGPRIQERRQIYHIWKCVPRKISIYCLTS